MQVFISDLHLTDGSSGETINSGALRVFSENLKTLVTSVAKKGDVTELRIVLLGDIFDVIRSAKWIEAGVNVRPWSPMDQEQGAIVLNIVRGILESNKEAISYLTGLRKFADDQETPFHLEYVIGNHDWLINRYSDCRDEIAKALGIFDGGPTHEFPLEVFSSDYKTFATHGDRYDGFNFKDNRDQSSIGDAIVIELLSRYPIEVKNELDFLVNNGQLTSTERDGIVARLKELDNVRPLLDTPSWVLMVLSATKNKAACRVINDAWKKCVDDFFKVSFIKDMDVPFWPDTIDFLQSILQLSSHGSKTSLEKISELKNKYFATGFEGDYTSRARAEPRLVSGEASYVLYGHTHDYMIVPLYQAEFTGGETLDKIYFNTGTWRQTWNKAVFDDSKREFIGWKVLTYIAFYNDKENTDYSYEVWNGVLGKGFSVIVNVK